MTRGTVHREARLQLHRPLIQFNDSVANGTTQPKAPDLNAKPPNDVFEAIWHGLVCWNDKDFRSTTVNCACVSYQLSDGCVKHLSVGAGLHLVDFRQNAVFFYEKVD